ncbi:MAG: hypothetical protein AB7L92_04700 [Alphaproteobacteria bacterium]
MKNNSVQKKLLFETMAIVIALMVLGGLLYFLSTWHEEKESANRGLQTQLTSLQNEMQSLSNKYTSWRQNNALYEEALQKSKNNQLSLNPNAIRAFFKRYKDEFMLSEVNLRMAPMVELEGPEFKKNTASMVYSEVNVEFEALTDLDVFRVLDSIEREFGGKVKMLSVAVTRHEAVAQKVLRQIAVDGSAKMVSAKVRFLWMGINQTDPQTPAPTAAPADGMTDAPVP